MLDTNRLAAAPVRKVVVVNGGADVLDRLEGVLDAGRYDMVFVESSDRAYSHVRTVLPDLVILWARIEHLDEFQLLTMLKLDPETRGIPVLAYTTECEGQDCDAAASPVADNDEDLWSGRPAPRMN